MAVGIAGVGGPAIYGDEDLLVHELRGLAGAETDAWEGAREGSCENSLLGERGEVGCREGRAVQVAYIAIFHSPISAMKPEMDMGRKNS